MKEEIVIVGAGGHARSCIEAVESTGRFRIVGLVGAPSETGKSVLGFTVIGTDADLPRIRKECRNAVVGIGQILTPEPRRKAYIGLREAGFTLPVIVASSAVVSTSASVGEGTIIFHFAMLNANARVGVNCIINTRALLEHDVVIGDHTHISTGALLNGGASAGDGSFVGSGSVIREEVKIGAGCVISMGSRVTHNVNAGGRFPARNQ